MLGFCDDFNVFTFWHYRKSCKVASDNIVVNMLFTRVAITSSGSLCKSIVHKAALPADDIVGSTT